jgi:hypothetical protein
VERSWQFVGSGDKLQKREVFQSCELEQCPRGRLEPCGGAPLCRERNLTTLV